MATVEIHATASHAYYMRKTKAEILRRIATLMGHLGYSKAQIDFEHVIRKDDDKYKLASRAMELHREFPPNALQ